MALSQLGQKSTKPELRSDDIETDAVLGVKDVSVDALFDDLFGLNLRAMKTLGVAFAYPHRLSTAAWSEDWENSYTPSFRLWFTLIAVLFFFQFFWAGDNSALIRLYAAQLESSGSVLPEGVSTLDASRYYARINLTVLPFASAFCLFACGLLYKGYGVVVPVTVRVRYVFAVIIPSTALALPLFWILGMASELEVGAFIVLSWLIPLPVDAWVAYKGVFSSLSGIRRVGRSVALSLALFVSLALSAVISSLMAGAWIFFQHGS